MKPNSVMKSLVMLFVVMLVLSGCEIVTEYVPTGNLKVVFNDFDDNFDETSGSNDTFFFYIHVSSEDHPEQGGFMTVDYGMIETHDHVTIIDDDEEYGNGFFVGLPLIGVGTWDITVLHFSASVVTEDKSLEDLRADENYEREETVSVTISDRQLTTVVYAYGDHELTAH